MFDFIDDDHITVVLRSNNGSDMPDWFARIIADIIDYYYLPITHRNVLNNRPLLEEYMTKRGFEFEYFNFEKLPSTNYGTFDSTTIHHYGYVFKSTPELSAYILRTMENNDEHQ